jgi:hypothetical protein
MCWAICKREYRKSISNLRVNQIPFDHLTVVQEALTKLESKACKRIAEFGWRALENAQPIQPEPPTNPVVGDHEEVVDND